jgi:hypothetical protein
MSYRLLCRAPRPSARAERSRSWSHLFEPPRAPRTARKRDFGVVGFDPAPGAARGQSGRATGEIFLPPSAPRAPRKRDFGGDGLRPPQGAARGQSGRATGEIFFFNRQGDLGVVGFGLTQGALRARLACAACWNSPPCFPRRHDRAWKPGTTQGATSMRRSRPAPNQKNLGVLGALGGSKNSPKVWLARNVRIPSFAHHHCFPRRHDRA